ncbi:hypothetical protein SeLEV6574_g06919 [Synchytrium endobioticum]|uniref:Anaphase-promoting complex subunit 5 n=1 Tax=Synchytrium endobioticum TaxID=286115 RepID=A0A507CFR2_9FUNG|nr:hypothetical protein SeLEV6574_g06919 [Synchytrium endobioticum]
MIHRRSSFRPLGRKSTAFVLPAPSRIDQPAIVHSTHFISPHKISLLILTEYYCAPSTTTIVSAAEILAILNRHLRDAYQGQWPEPPLYELLNDIADISIITCGADGIIMDRPKSLGLMLWERIQSVKTPDDLFLMAEGWKEMARTIDENAADYDDGVVIDRESPLGEFIRRACLEHSSMPFDERTWLYSALLVYINTSRDKIPSFPSPSNTLMNKLTPKPVAIQPPRYSTTSPQYVPCDDLRPSSTRAIIEGTPPEPSKPSRSGSPRFTPEGSVVAAGNYFYGETSTPGVPYSRTVDPDTPMYSITIDRDRPQYGRQINPGTPSYSRGVDADTPMYSRAMDAGTPINTVEAYISTQAMTDEVTRRDKKCSSKARQREEVPVDDGVMQVLSQILPKVAEFVPTYNSHRYIESQIEVLRLARAPSVSLDLQQTMDRMMVAAGGYAQAHLLSFLHYMRLGEYEGASMSLHRFHDHFIEMEDQNCMAQISLFNRVALHLRFHRKKEAVFDLHEAINRSREQVNTACLSFALRWLNQLTSTTAVSTKPNALIPQKALPYNMISMVADLEASRQAVMVGKPPIVAFGHMVRSIAIQLDYDSDGMGKAEPHGFGVIHQVESSLWDAYGNDPMANLCNEVEIVQHKNTNKVEDQIVAQCHYARKCAENGRYEEAFRTLEKLETWCPLPLMDCASAWLECKNSLEFQHAYFCGDWNLAETISNRLGEFGWFGTKALARVSFLRQLVESGKGNATSAYHEIARLIKKTSIAKSEGFALNCLLALADIHLNASSPLGALNVILTILTLSQQLSAQQQHQGALLRLVDVLLYLDLPFQALQVTRYVLPRALGCGDLHLEGFARMTYGRAIVAAICAEQGTVSNGNSGGRSEKVDRDEDVNSLQMTNDLTMAVNQFELALSCFKTMKDVKTLGKCMYFLTRTLDMAGRHSERDVVAAKMMQLMPA